MFNVYGHITLQPIFLGILRSDYMLDHDKSSGEPKSEGLPDNKNLSIKQVEVNTIAAALGGLGSLMGELHRYFINDD